MHMIRTAERVTGRSIAATILFSAAVVLSPSQALAQTDNATADTTSQVVAAVNTLPPSPIPEGADTLRGDRNERGELILTGRLRQGNYVVNDDLLVPDDESLRLDPGVSLYFLRGETINDKFNIKIQGELDAVGTEEEPIVFTSGLREPSARSKWRDRYWGGIMIIGSKAKAELNWGRIVHAEVAIQIRKGVDAIAFTLPSDGSAETETFSAEKIGGDVETDTTALPTGPVRIANTTVDSSAYVGITTSGVVNNVVLEDNLIQGGTTGIACEEGATPIIRGNRILGNRSIGLQLTGGSHPLVETNTVASNNTAGIICAGNSNPGINDCVIAKNGVGVSITESSPNLERCTIAGNDFSGIVLHGNSSVRVTDSNLRSNGYYQIDNRGPNEIDATGNWWGKKLSETDRPRVYDSDAVPEGTDNRPGWINAGRTLSEPNPNAPGAPDRAKSLTLFTDANHSEALGERTISNGDTIYIEIVAEDESPYLEDEAAIVLTTSGGQMGRMTWVLTEQSPAGGIYRGYFVASLAEGNPNTTIVLANDQTIQIFTATEPPIKTEARFVSLAPETIGLKVDGEREPGSLINPHPVFTWAFYDNEGDPQTASQIEVGDDPAWMNTPVWTHEMTGNRTEAEYDGLQLERGTTYYIRVRVHDGFNFGDWAENQFRMNTIPPPPMPSEPENGALVTSDEAQPPVVIENCVDADGDKISYRFEAYYDEEMTRRKKVGGRHASPGDVPIVEDPSGRTTWSSMPALFENSRIWWRAKASDGLEESDWSEVWSFTLNTEDQDIFPFKLLGPPNDSAVVTTQPTFTWEYTYDPDPGESVEFLVRYGRDRDLVLNGAGKITPLTPRSEQSYHVPGVDRLSDNKWYWWNVWAKYTDSDETVLVAGEGPRRFFTNSENDPPEFAAISPLVIKEDKPSSIFVISRYVSDEDNAPSDLTYKVEGTPHIEASIDADTRLTLTPERNWYGGPEYIRLMAADPILMTDVRFAEFMLEVNVEPANDPPTLTVFDPVTINEDGQVLVELGSHAEDIDNSPSQLIWSAAYDDSRLKVEINGGTATITGVRNWNGGPEPVTLTVRDPGGSKATTRIQVTVTSVNDAPVVTQIPDLKFKEDQSASITLDHYVKDVDNLKSQLKWTAQIPPPLLVSIDEGTRTARVSAPENWNGTGLRLGLTVADPSGASNTITLTVNIEGINDPPVIKQIPDREWNEDTTIELTLDDYVTDNDHDHAELIWTATGQQQIQVVINPRLRRATLSQPPNWYGGPERVRFTVKDPANGTATSKAAFKVKSVPEIPIFTRIPAISFEEDGTATLALDKYLSDPDHQPAQLTITATSGANVKAQLNRASRVITFNAPDNWSGGPQAIRITARDSDGGQAVAEVPVTVTPVNDVPVLRNIPAVAFKEDETATINLGQYVTDVDDTQFRWSATGQEQVNVRIDPATSIATFSAPSNWNGGPERITITVTDTKGGTAEKRVPATVRAVNDPPVLATVPVVTFAEDGSFTLDIAQYVTDPDDADAQMTVRVTGARQVRTQVNGTTISFSAAPDWNGQESLNVSVTDPSRGLSQGALAVTVRPVNDPPTTSNIPAMSFNQGGQGTLNLSRYGSDEEDSQLTWRVQGATGGLTVNIAGQVLTASAAADFSGSVTVSLIVADRESATASASLAITVRAVAAPAPTN